MVSGKAFLKLTIYLAGLAVLASVAILGQGKPAEKTTYSGPRFPSYVVKEPKSIEEMMPNARALARNTRTFQAPGFGALKADESVLIVTSAFSEDMVIEAVRRALQERRIRATFVPDYELAGVSRNDVKALVAKQATGAQDGFWEARTFWLNNAFADQKAVRDWLKATRPDLYEKVYPPKMDLPPNLEQVRNKLIPWNFGPLLVKYLQKHPEIQKVYWGKGGAPFLRRTLHPLENKYVGIFVTDNRWDLMSQAVVFPGDLWLAVEEQPMEPLAHVDKVHITDPEGTDVSWELNELQAQRWAQGVYLRGHLFLHPTQAAGRYAYSVVNFPAVTDWVPREPLVLTNGVAAGTNGHGGFFPRMEIHYKNGYIVDVRGGGTYGEIFRTFLKYPHANDVTYPYHEGHPGYWYHYEVALGTHPKVFRNPMEFYGKAPGLGLGAERLRSGVFHFGNGLELAAGPENQGIPTKWFAFADDHKLPRTHGWHVHNYFATYDVHLRGTDRWVTLVKGGRVTALDDVEVRALASRYGDPDKLLAEEWVPEVPGLNAPGRYEDYAKDPWSYSKAVMDKILAGTYEHFYAPAHAK